MSNEELVQAVGVIHHLDCPPPDPEFASGCEEQPRAAALVELARRLEAAEAALRRIASAPCQAFGFECGQCMQCIARAYFREVEGDTP